MAVEAPRISLEVTTLQSGRFLQRKQLVWGIAAAGLSLILFLVAALLILPESFVVQERSKAAQKAANATTQRAALITNLTPEDRENFIRIAQTLPQSKEPFLVLKAIESIAQESEVSVGAFDSNPGLISTAAAVVNRAASGQRSNQLVRISIELKGTFDQISRALELLESSTPIMEVTELSLSPDARFTGEQSLESLRYTALLQVTSYFMAPQSVQSKPATPITPAQKKTLEILQTWRNRLPAAPTISEDYARLNLFTTEIDQVSAPEAQEIPAEDSTSSDSATLDAASSSADQPDSTETDPNQ